MGTRGMVACTQPLAAEVNALNETAPGFVRHHRGTLDAWQMPACHVRRSLLSATAKLVISINDMFGSFLLASLDFDESSINAM